jgi:hypothetical protein
MDPKQDKYWCGAVCNLVLERMNILLYLWLFRPVTNYLNHTLRRSGKSGEHLISLQALRLNRRGKIIA